jgi:diadenylate cyclase
LQNLINQIKLALGLNYSFFINCVDIIVVAFLIYRGLLLIKGTRSFAMVVGLGGIVLLYMISQELGLLTLSWILGSILNSVILLIVVIFQEEIRRALTKFGLNPLLSRPRSVPALSAVIEDVSLAAIKLSKANLGALIVIQREVGLDNIIEDAVILDARVNRKLLFSIFTKESPLHDGAVLLVNDRIRAAGCVLPLSFNPDLDPNLGTRHRAALGLSEQCDAIIIVVSEESATVSVASEGRLIRNLDLNTLKDYLKQSNVSLDSSSDLEDNVVGVVT